MPRPSEESPYRLLVEGDDDLHSVIHLLALHGFDWDDERKVRPYLHAEGGAENLLKVLPVALKGTYERIGVILDANASLSNRWAQLRERSNRLGVELPDSPLPDGTICEGPRPGRRFGVWIMPDNASAGALESFLSRLVPAADTIWSYAGEVVAEARMRGARCLEKDHDKSVLRTWLAWQEEPGLRFGTALRARIFDQDSETARRFVAWFNRLFVEP
ncbi:MAG: DUF3226 domain-containing protein [Thermoanaerobaculia bacterium]